MKVIETAAIPARNGGAIELAVVRMGRRYWLEIRQDGEHTCPPIEMRDGLIHPDTQQPMTSREYAAFLIRGFRQDLH